MLFGIGVSRSMLTHVRLGGGGVGRGELRMGVGRGGWEKNKQGIMLTERTSFLSFSVRASALAEKSRS